MASNIELEIAMSMVQLTGVTLPVLLGILRYYFKKPNIFEEAIEAHDVFIDDASFSDFFLLIVSTLYISHTLAAAFIGANVHLNVGLAVGAYSLFLGFVTFFALLPLGESIIEDIQQAVIRVGWGFTVIVVCLILLNLVFGSIASATVFTLIFITLIIPIFMWYFYYRHRNDDQSNEQEEDCEEERSD